MQSAHIICWLLLSISFLPLGRCQEDVMRSDIAFGIQLASPRSAFDRATDDEEGFGIRLAYYYQVRKDLPVLLGLDVNYAVLNSRATKYFMVDDGGNQYEVRERITNQFVRSQFRVNYHFFQYGPVAPFVEFHGGIQYYFSISTLNDLDGDRDFDPLTEEADLSMTYGVTLGCEYNIQPDLAVYARAELSFGTSTDMLVLDKSVPDEDIHFPIDYFRKTESSTDLFLLEAGVLGRF